jgi:hypothetical protein
MEQRCETTKTPRERTHNPEVAGSNPAPATTESQVTRYLPFEPTFARFACATRIATQRSTRRCESSAALSHIGSGTFVSLSDPAPVPQGQWLRDLCPTKSTTSSPGAVMTCAHASQLGSRHAGGAFDGLSRMRSPHAQVRRRLKATVGAGLEDVVTRATQMRSSGYSASRWSIRHCRQRRDATRPTTTRAIVTSPNGKRDGSLRLLPACLENGRADSSSCPLATPRLACRLFEY